MKIYSLTEAQKDIRKNVVQKEFILSKESGEEGDGIGALSVIYVKVLSWQAPKVGRLFKA